MKCEQIHPLFSDLMDGELSGDLDSAARQHLGQCEDCRAELETFIDATRALRTLSASKTSAEYVANIMTCVDGAGPAGKEDAGRRVAGFPRKVGSHAFSALIGAAAALLLFRLLIPEAVPPADSPAHSMAPPQRVEIPTPLRLLQGSGSLVRGGQTEKVDPRKPLWFQPGDIYRIQGGADMTLALGDSGVVRIETIPAPRPEPKIIEKLIEKTRVVRRGPLVAIELDNAVLTRAAERVSRSIDSIRSSLRQVGQVGHAARTQDNAASGMPAAPDSETTGATGATGATVTSVTSVTSEEPTPIAPPVVIRRTADRLILETSGQPFEVLPALIGFLDDSDPNLVEMVLDRLETIRRELNNDPALLGSLALEPQEPPEPGPLDRFKSLFSATGKAPDPRSLSDTERWNRWWERNAMRILQADTYGTL